MLRAEDIDTCDSVRGPRGRRAGGGSGWRGGDVGTRGCSGVSGGGGETCASASTRFSRRWRRSVKTVLRLRFGGAVGWDGAGLSAVAITNPSGVLVTDAAASGNGFARGRVAARAT